MKKITAFIFAIVLAILSTTVAFAHGGRTDRYGGHRDNRNVSGLGYYHYHCNGNPPHLHYAGYCPFRGYVGR